MSTKLCQSVLTLFIGVSENTGVTVGCRHFLENPFHLHCRYDKIDGTAIAKIKDVWMLKLQELWSSEGGVHGDED
jgi:hypothetical protein